MDHDEGSEDIVVWPWGWGAKPPAGKFFEYFDQNNASLCKKIENSTGGSHVPIPPPLAKPLIEAY